MSDIDKEQLAVNTDMDVNDTSLEIHSDALDEDNTSSLELDGQTTQDEVDVVEITTEVDDTGDSEEEEAIEAEEVDEESSTELDNDETTEDEDVDGEDTSIEVVDAEDVDDEETSKTNEVDDKESSNELDDVEADVKSSNGAIDDENEEEAEDIDSSVATDQSGDVELDAEDEVEEESLELDEAESEVIGVALESELEDEAAVIIEDESELENDAKPEEKEESEDDTDSSKEPPAQSSLENISDSAKKSFYALREWQQARSDLREAKRKLESIELELSDQQSLYDMRRDVENNYDKLTLDNETKSKELKSEIEDKQSLINTLESRVDTLETDYKEKLQACIDKTELSSSNKSKAKNNLASMTSILKDTERRRVVSEGRLKEIKVKRANKIESLSSEIREANRLAQKYTENARALSVGDKARCIEVKEKAEVQKLKAERLTEELEMVTKEFDAKVAFTTKSFEDADAEFNKAKENVSEAKDEFENVTKTHSKHEAEAREITDEYEANKKGLIGEIESASSRIDECSDELETISSYQLQIDSIISSPEKTRALSNKVAHLKEDLEFQAGDVKMLEQRFSEIEDRTTSERKILFALLGVVLLLIILSFQ